MAQKEQARRLKFEIFRYNPEDENSEPHTDLFELDEAPFMTLYIALNQIREKYDPGLQFDFACRSAICGSCAMMVNGRPALACRTLTSDLPDKICLYPLPVFKLIGDLSVDTGTWFRAMVERTEAWIHAVGSGRDGRTDERRYCGGNLRERSLHRVRLLRCGVRRSQYRL